MQHNMKHNSLFFVYNILNNKINKMRKHRVILAVIFILTVGFSWAQPVLNPLTISSNNANSASLGIVGDLVTISFTSSEALFSTSATIAGRAVAITDLGGLNYSATLLVDGTEPEGGIAFTLNYEDIGGTPYSSDNADITDGSSVTLDFTLPSLNPLTISSNNGNDPALAINGDVVTVAFTASETLAVLPTATIGGRVALVTNTGGLNYTATLTTNGTEPEGVATFVINYSDAAGNGTSSSNANITNGSSVTLDYTAPTLNPLIISSDNANNAYARVGNTVTVTFTASELLSSPNGTIGGQPAVVTNTGGLNYIMTRIIDGTEPEAIAAIVINYSDAAGNVGSSTNANITDASSVTLDFTSPTLNPLTISSNNANSASLAIVGDVITVSFTASETLNAPTATIGGQVALVTNTGGLNYTATRAMDGTEAEGVATISLNYTDAAGNVGSAANADITDASSVTIDFTDPSLNPLTISSNNANPVLARNGDIVTVLFTVSEVLAALPTATIGGRAALVTNTGGLNYSAVLTVNGTEPEGVALISINYSDAAGNVASAANADITNGSSVTFDFTTPTLNPLTISSNNANNALAKIGNTVTVSFTASELLVSPTGTIGGGAAAVTNTGGLNYTATRIIDGTEPEGIAALTLNFSDASGNAGSAANVDITNGSSVTLDFTTPTLNPLIISSNNANDAALAIVGDVVTIAFTASEALSGPSATIGGLPAVVTNVGGFNYTATRSIDGTEPEGVAAIVLNYADATGNAGSSANIDITDGSSVTIDFSFPTINPLTISSNNANPSLGIVGDVVTVAFTTDEALTVGTTATIGGRAAVVNNVGLNYTATLTLNGTEPEGVVAFVLNYSDAAGNTGSSNNADITNGSSVTLDFTAPTLNPLIISSNNADNTLARSGDVVTISFTASETLVAPSATIGGAAAAVVNTGGLNYTATRIIDGTEVEGLATINLNYTDASGNPGTSTNADITDGSSVTLDFTAPTLNPLIIYSNNANTALAAIGDVVTVLFTASELLSAPTATIGGQAAVVTNIVGFNYSATRTMDGTETEGVLGIVINLSDATGNTGTATNANITDGSSVTTDFTVPSLNPLTIISNNVNNTSLAKDGDVVTISFTASETLSALPTATIGGRIAVVTNIGGLNYTATRTLDESETPGVAAIIINYNDQSGNPGTSTNADITNGSSVTLDFTAPANQDVVFGANVNQFGGTVVTIASSGDVTNKVWFAPIGQANEAAFVAGPTMTQAATGTATTIIAPANTGTYYLYIIDEAGNVSNSSVASLAVVNTPVLDNIEGGSLRYLEGDPATQLTNTITVDDDSDNIASATIQITGNYQVGEDVLAGGGGVWAAGPGTLTITGPMTRAAMQTALRAVTYENTSATPSNLVRTVSFTIDDGIEVSNTVTRTINLTPILYVPADNATIQAAINAAIDGDQIAVSNGTYVENINFNGKQIEIVGNVSNPNLVIIDGGGTGSVVTFNSGETNTSILRGFTIQNGSGTLINPPGVVAPEAYYGGGIYCDGSSPLLENLVVTGNNLPLNGNVGSSGAGIFLTNGANIELNNSTISNNTAIGYRGGGVSIDNSSPIFDQVTITNNDAGNYGGGLTARNATLNFSNVTITNNTANGLMGRGGGMYLINCTHTIIGLTINGNSSTLPGNNVCTFNTLNVIPLVSPGSVRLD